MVTFAFGGFVLIPNSRLGLFLSTSNVKSSTMDCYVKIFRSELERFGCPLVENVDDNELKKWFFSSGSARLTLLQWCLLKLDQEQFETYKLMTDKDIFGMARSNGVCGLADEGVIVGTAPLKKQCKLWKKLFLLLEAAKEVQTHTPTQLQSKYLASQDLTHELGRTEAIWDLMATKVNLLPLELRLASKTISLMELQEQLHCSEQKLQELEKAVNESTDCGDFSSDGFDLKKFKTNINNNQKEIERCHKHLGTKIFPLLKGTSSNPLCEHLGCIVDAVADKGIALAKMLQDRQSIKLATDDILSSQDSGDTSSSMLQTGSEMHQIISRSSSLLSDGVEILRQVSVEDMNSQSQ